MSTDARPAARIETDRLLLRVWEEADAPDVRAALDASDAHLRPWVPFMKSEPQSLEGTRKWVTWRREQFEQGGNFCYGVFDKESEALLGEVMLLGRAGPGALEIGYWIDVRHVGRGYATEAVAALVAAGFALPGCERLSMVCDPRNDASHAIPRKLGFTHETTKVDHYKDHEGQSRDSMIWSLAKNGTG